LPRILTALALVLPATAGLAADVPAPVPKKTPVLSMLPDGSELKGVMLPRYDEDHKLVGVLKAHTMRLVNAGRIDGKTVAIELFNPDQSPKGRIDLVSATIYQDTGIVTTKEPVEIKSDRMTASGSGIHYSFKQGKGFLLGPTTTVLKPKPGTP
jgi:Lipopolysaccharide-assembly, LptC-related